MRGGDGRGPRPRWRLLASGPADGAWNMACDAALLESAGAGAAPPTLRLYGWNPPAVSLGRNQPEPAPGAAAALAARGAGIVWRPTGGRAVWHGPPEEELTYAVAAPLGRPPLDAGLVEAYRRIHAALAAGLRDLGVDAALAPRRPGRRPPGPASRLACFAASVPYEIEVAGRKLLGSAQRRTRAGLLQHGSLPLAGNQAVLAAAWPGSLAEGAATTVAAAAGRRLPAARVADALAAAFERELGVRLEPGALTGGERRSIAVRLGEPGSLDTSSRGGRYSRLRPHR